VAVSPGQTVGDAAERYAHSFQSDFPVMDGRRLLGLVTREILVETLHKQGPSAAVEEVMVRDFPTATEQTPLIEVLERMQSSERKVVPVIRAGELVGLLTLEQIGRYNMLCSGFSCEFLEPTKPGA